MKLNVVIFKCVLALLFVVSLVRSFYGYDASDESSYLAAAYSLTTGSELFVDCWDVHQTSALMLAPLVLFYVNTIGSTAGIILAMRLLYCVVTFALSMITLHVLMRGSRAHIQRFFAFTAAALVQVVAPANISTLSYNTLPVVFLLLSAMLLSSVSERLLRLRLVGSGICFSAAVQAYPFMVLALPAFAMIVLACEPVTKRRSRLGLCVLWVCGALVPLVVFSAVLFFQGNIGGALESLPLVLTDPEHGESGSLGKIVDYFKVLWGYLGILGGLFLAATYGLALLSRVQKSFCEVRDGLAVCAKIFASVGIFAWICSLLVMKTSWLTCVNLLQLGLALYLPALMIVRWRGTSWSFWLWVAGFLASFAGQIGSNVGFNLSSYFAVIASVGACAYLAQAEYEAVPTCEPGVVKVLDKVFRVSLTLALCGCLSVTLYAKLTSVYRDGSLDSLNTQITVGPAAGLMTTAQSKEWYDQCFEAITEYGKDAKGLFVGVLFPTGYLMLPTEVMAPRVWRTALDATDLREWYEKHDWEMPDLIFIKDGELWGYDQYPDDDMSGIVGDLIALGFYEEFDTPIGKVFRRE